MLRISVRDDEQSLTFQLEGRLAGSWLRELEECWQVASASAAGKPVRFDLTQVTYVDGAGKSFLAARYGEGAQLIAAGCLMRGIVAEITNTPKPECSGEPVDFGGCHST